jgi:2-polyprenyl-3-methyl-5-hydroxy-6-metoxy-1,4-benzoquinol methylase
MPDFSKRSYDIEIMDDLTSSGDIIDKTLRELEIINALLGGNYVTIDGIKKLTTKHSKASFTVADLGCGSGDILRLIMKWARKKNIILKLFGIDANPAIAQYAKEHTPAGDNITFESIDIFSDEFRKRRFDIVVGTLFFHHFTNEQLTDFFKQLRSQTAVGIIINDIHRHWFAYYSIKWLTALFSKSSMVKNDAPLSVLRAFRKEELVQIIKGAGHSNFTIRWMWAFRWQVIIKTH